MKSEKLSFEKDLWNKYNLLHERLRKKNEYIKLLKKSLEPIYEITKELEKKIHSFKIALDPTAPSNIINEESESSDSTEKKLSGISLTINTYIDFCKNFIEKINQTFFLIINGFEDLLKRIKTEKDDYNSLIKCLKSLSDNKNIMDKNMKLYHQKMSAAENIVYDLKKAEYRQLTVSNDITNIESGNLLKIKSTQLVNECVKPFKTYFDSVQKVNEIREESIEKQRLLLIKYQNIEEEIGNANISTSKIILLTLENINKEIVEKSIEEFNNISKNINVNKDMQQFISENKGNEKPEEEILFINFKSTINFNESENNQTYEIYKQTIEFIKAVVENEYPNYDEELEKEKNNLREILYKLFSNYEQEIAEKIMEYINNTKMHQYFLILLSKLRTNNRYQQKKEMIEFLGNILNIILDESEKTNNIINSKNCIILSQTFYYIQNEEKYYLLDKIINHKWFTKKNYWINFADILIEPEIDKLLERNPEITKEDIKNNYEKIDSNFKKKINEILFSQLLSIVNNMNEFKLSIENAVEITEKILNKYNYLSDEEKNNLFSMISPDQNKVNALRINIVKNIEKEEKIEKKEINNNKKEKIEKKEIKKEKNERKEINNDKKEKNEKKEIKKEKTEKKEKKEKNIEKNEINEKKEIKNKIKDINNEKKLKINDNKKNEEDNIININNEKKKENKNIKEINVLNNEDKKLISEKRKSANVDFKNNKNKEKEKIDKERKKSGIIQNIKNKFINKEKNNKENKEKKEEKKEINTKHKNPLIKDLGNQMLKIDSNTNKFNLLKPIPKNDINNNKTNKNNDKNKKNDNNEKQSNAPGNAFGVVLKKISTNNGK